MDIKVIRTRLNNISSAVLHLYAAYVLYYEASPTEKDVLLMTNELIKKNITIEKLPGAINNYAVTLSERVNGKPMLKIKYSKKART